MNRKCGRGRSFYIMAKESASYSGMRVSLKVCRIIRKKKKKVFKLLVLVGVGPHIMTQFVGRLGGLGLSRVANKFTSQKAAGWPGKWVQKPDYNLSMHCLDDQRRMFAQII